MTCNIGAKDKALRVVAGLVLVVLGIVYQTIWGLLGIPLVVTAILGYCPAYSLFKISTVGAAGRKDQSPPK